MQMDAARFANECACLATSYFDVLGSLWLLMKLNYPTKKPKVFDNELMVDFYLNLDQGCLLGVTSLKAIYQPICS